MARRGPSGGRPGRRRLSPVRFARQRAFHSGLLGGQRGWMAVGAGLWLARLAKRAFGRTEEHVALDQLRAGQGIEIRAVRTPTRRERRRSRAAAG